MSFSTGQQGLILVKNYQKPGSPKLDNIDDVVDDGGGGDDDDEDDYYCLSGSPANYSRNIS